MGSNNVRSLALSDIDLAVSIDTGRIVPTQATDLNLYHFFGNEQVNVPVTIENRGVHQATGDVTVTTSATARHDCDKTNSRRMSNSRIRRLRLRQGDGAGRTGSRNRHAPLHPGAHGSNYLSTQHLYR